MFRLDSSDADSPLIKLLFAGRFDLTIGSITEGPIGFLRNFDQILQNKPPKLKTLKEKDDRYPFAPRSSPTASGSSTSLPSRTLIGRAPEGTF
jgi:hypothetical protein